MSPGGADEGRGLKLAQSVTIYLNGLQVQMLETALLVKRKREK